MPNDLNREGLEAAQRAIPAGHGQAWVYAETAIRAYLAHAKPDTAALVEALNASYSVLATAFNRIHSLPRGTDTELAKRIGNVRAQIEAALSTVPAKSAEGEPVAAGGDGGLERCPDCAGSGLRLNMAGEPDDCRLCGGSGHIYCPPPGDNQ